MNISLEKPLVTVITVCYNSSKTIERTIKSVLEQSYGTVEYIIIDGASTDGTQDIIKKYSSKITHWVSEKDGGIYEAMNKGLKISNGKLISILNSDDWYENDTISKIVEGYIKHPEIDIYHGLLRFYDRNNIIDSIVGHCSSFLNTGMIEHPTCFVKKTLYEAVGFFDLKYRSAADYDWTLRAKKHGASFMLLPIICTNFSRGGMSDSSLGFLEELKIKKKYKVISHSKYLCWKFFTIIKSLFEKS